MTIRVLVGLINKFLRTFCAFVAHDIRDREQEQLAVASCNQCNGQETCRRLRTDKEDIHKFAGYGIEHCKNMHFCLGPMSFDLIKYKFADYDIMRRVCW